MLQAILFAIIWVISMAIAIQAGRQYERGQSEPPADLQRASAIISLASLFMHNNPSATNEEAVALAKDVLQWAQQQAN